MAQFPHPGALLRVLLGALVRRAAACVAALPPVVGAPLALVPVAAGTAVVVASLAAAAQPLERSLALPEREFRPTWSGEVAAFADRLESGFGIDDGRARDFAAWILEASARQQMPAELIAGLIYTESSFRKRVRSWAGAVGPTQVKPVFWRDFCGGVDLNEPEQNVYCGAQVLAHYMDRCGAFDCALRLYNVGPTNFRDPYYRKRSGLYLAKVESHRSLMESGPGQ